MCIDWVSKVRLDKIARCLSVLRAKKPSWDKTAIFLSVWRQKEKTNQRTKLSIHILDTIESKSTTRFMTWSSDRMMTSNWLVDVSDDRYTTIINVYFSNLIVPLSCLCDVDVENDLLITKQFYFDTFGGRHGRYRMVVRFITTYAISACHHKIREFEFHSGKVHWKQHYVIKFVSDLRQVGRFLRVLQFPPPLKPTATI